MKRDMDLIRDLLLRLEALPVPAAGMTTIDASQTAVQVDGYTAEQINYHLSLLEQAQLIHAGGLDFGMQFGGGGVGFQSLTWAGHDFLDATRNPDVWGRTKQAANAAGGFTVELLVFAAKTYLEGKIKGVIGG
ncbi:DUF2513 domain-containing protein [Paraburkholderia aspalathi]|uniref:DUF2513 domain-containing protein n=1 Tax=Paraburkholderia aspalathi TaxID=1324617 RepID=UPI0038B8914F